MYYNIMIFSAYMIVFKKSEKRLKNYEDIKKIFPELLMFEAIDCINDYDLHKKNIKNKNIFTQEYINYCDLHHPKLGCNLSHYNLLLNFLNKGNTDWILVLEDDINLDRFNNKIVDRLISIAEKQKSNFIQLYTNPKFIENQKTAEYVISNIYKMIPQWGLVAYLINKKGIQTILSKLPWNDNCDIIVSKYTKELNALSFINSIFINKGATCSTDKSSDFGSLLWNINSN
jgi:GR25 family glycosyltransferase involved in LPS biosynthesis